MFNKYNLIIALILICSFVFGYKREDISSGFKRIFSKKEEIKSETETAKEVDGDSAVVTADKNKDNPSPASVFPLQQNPQTLGKTLDSISAGTIPEEQIRKHQEYLKNITTKLKDFQGGVANIPPETPTPAPPAQAQSSDPNQAPNPPRVPLFPQAGNGFEQVTPTNPTQDLVEETDDAEDPDEADDTEGEDDEEADDDAGADEEVSADADEAENVNKNIQ